MYICIYIAHIYYVCICIAAWRWLELNDDGDFNKVNSSSGRRHLYDHATQKAVRCSMGNVNSAHSSRLDRRCKIVIRTTNGTERISLPRGAENEQISATYYPAANYRHIRAVFMS